ncbi:colicin E3/pyocin S6 family cytotoxin [Aneurinibacillus aneurinilyticus]|nr:colicin E3/pyocin S6 family cytotoxin [Aneurinibacillus aneurinilyticus]
MKEKGMKKVKGTKRDTWQSTDGHYWQWDAEGGKLEKWNRNKNKHLGEFDPVNGKQTKPAKPGRQWDR